MRTITNSAVARLGRRVRVARLMQQLLAAYQTVPSIPFAVGNTAGTLRVRLKANGAAPAGYPASVTFEAAAPARIKVIFGFDSISDGVETTGYVAGSHVNGAVDVSKKDYPAQTTVRLGSEYYTLNLGIAGQTLYEVVANAATALDPYVLADIDDFDYVVVMILAGTNDIALHQRTAEQTYAKMIELCNHLSALSPKVVPVPVTMLERFNFFAADIDSAGFAAARNTFNTNIRNEYATFAPTFWDAALLNIQLSVDQVHPTDVGAETMSIAAATFIPTAVGATGGGATEVPIEETDSRWEFLPEGAWQRSDEVNEASGKHIMYTFNPDGVARLTPTCNRVDFENHLAGSGGNVKVTLLDGTVLGTFSQNGSGPDRVRTQISSPSMANQKIVYTWGDTGRGSILYVDLAIAVGGTFV